MGQMKVRQIAEEFWKIKAFELRFETIKFEEWYSRQKRKKSRITMAKKQKAGYVFGISNRAPLELNVWL